MRIAEGHEVIEAAFVEMDPLQEGFCGVLVELVATGGYAVVETAADTGNRLLLFRSQSPALAHSLFEAELGPAPVRSAGSRPIEGPRVPFFDPHRAVEFGRGRAF
jgi:hypothetical protein